MTKRDYSWIKPGLIARMYVGGKFFGRVTLREKGVGGYWSCHELAHGIAPEQLRPDRPRPTRKELRAEIKAMREVLTLSREFVHLAWCNQNHADPKANIHWLCREWTKVLGEDASLKKEKLSIDPPCRCAEFEEEPAYWVNVYEHMDARAHPKKETADGVSLGNRLRCEPVWRKKEPEK